MDLGLVFNPLPTATKMLDWIRNAPPDIVSVSVHHEGLIELAEMMGYDETADWVRDHRSEYARLLFAGVIVEQGGR